jgi:hypothetical protein
MGIFDFFRKKKVDPTPAAAPERDKPSAHYVLAHFALRQFALEDPIRYLGVMSSPHARKFLQMMLDDVSKDFAVHDFSVEDMHVHPTRIGDFACAILEFPLPRQLPEVDFTAVLVKVQFDGDDEPKAVSGSAHYMTLERGMAINGMTRTVLCEWTDTSHANFGDGPQPTLHGFMEALKKHQLSAWQ